MICYPTIILATTWMDMIIWHAAYKFILLEMRQECVTCFRVFHKTQFEFRTATSNSPIVYTRTDSIEMVIAIGISNKLLFQWALKSSSRFNFITPTIYCGYCNLSYQFDIETMERWHQIHPIVMDFRFQRSSTLQKASFIKMNYNH